MTVHLITGPPCSGKSTYVEQHRAPGDELVCFDTTLEFVRGAMPGRSDWTHRAAASDIIRSHVEHLTSGQAHPMADVWVIRCLPGAAARAALLEQLAQHHNVEHVHLQPSRDELHRRAGSRPDPVRLRRDIDRCLEQG